MNPVIQASTPPQSEHAPGATPLPAPLRPGHPSPLLTSAPSTSTKPALLSLKLNLSKGSGEADGQSAAPGSPSSRSKAKVHRSITEAGGQKRAIDGKDGPGSTSTTPGKRQKQSTPPASPRSSTSSGKQLVRQSRPVTDLKTMAGLTTRGSGPASPPSSPRAVATAQSAPRWRSTSYPVVPDGSRLPSPARPPRSGSLGIDPLDNGCLPNGAEPAATAIDKADENQPDFTFAECDFGQNGELTLARPNLPVAQNRLATSTAALPVSLSLTSTLIAAELLPKAAAQKIAAASYLASLSGQAMGSSSKKANLLAAAFKREQASLETDVTLVEIALEQNSPDDVARYLNSAADLIARLKSGLPALAGQKTDAGASASAGQLALSACLDAMEVACKVGVDLLADEQAQRLADTSTVSQPPHWETPVITPFNQALIDDLDALYKMMDEKIEPITAKPAPTAPPKE